MSRPEFKKLQIGEVQTPEPRLSLSPELDAAMTQLYALNRDELMKCVQRIHEEAEGVLVRYLMGPRSEPLEMQLGTGLFVQVTSVFGPAYAAPIAEG